MKKVKFTEMKKGSKKDYLFLNKLEKNFISGTVDRILKSLQSLKSGLVGYKINRREHSLQTATRALKENASEEMIVAALLHDIGDELAPNNHAEFAAAILKPYVSEKTYWIVEKHGIFQMYYYAHHLGGNKNQREKNRGHKYYEDTINFCEKWDQKSFDPNYNSLPLKVFEPYVRTIFSRTPHLN